MKKFLLKKRSILAILSGILICFLLFFLVKPLCLGLIFGVIAASMIAEVASPKEGAVIGAFVPIPYAIYATLIGLPQIFQQSNIDLPSLITGSIIGELFSILLMALVGAVIGLIVGKFYEMRRKGNATIF